MARSWSLHDMIGINEGHVPKFVKKYRQIGQIAREGIAEYVEEVRTGSFPTREYSYK